MLIQWEEDNPPGNCCFSRKQSERGLPATAAHEAYDAKVRPGRISEHIDHNGNEHRAGLEKGNVDAGSVSLR